MITRMALSAAMAAAFLAGPASPARAGVVLNFPGGTVATGGTLTVDVTGSGAALSDFSLGFELVGGTLTTPSFVNPSSAATDPTLIAPNYAFAVGSDDAATGTVFGHATPTNPGGPLVNFQGSDLEDGSDVTLGPGRNLLARLVIQAPQFVVNASGTDYYTLELVTRYTSFDTNDGTTPVPLDPSSVESVTITVTRGAMAVPEPPAAGMLAIGLAVAGYSIIRAAPRKHHRPVPPGPDGPSRGSRSSARNIRG